MRIEDIVVVATVREEIRSQKPFVDTTGLERRIEAAQVKVVAHVANGDETAEGELPNVAVTKDEVASAVTPSAVDMHRGNEHSVSPYVVWLVNGTVSLTRHRDCKVVAAEDSTAKLPSQKPEKKKKKGKHEGKKKGCDLGDKTQANVTKSEAIPDEGEAEHAVDTISKEGGEKGQARPSPSGLFGLPADTPSSQPVTQTTGQGLFGLPEDTPSSPVTHITGQSLFGSAATTQWSFGKKEDKNKSEPAMPGSTTVFGTFGAFGGIPNGGRGPATGNSSGSGPM